MCLCKICKPQQLVRTRHKKMALINSRQTLNPTPSARKLPHDNHGYSVIVSELTASYLNRGPDYCFLSEERNQLEHICVLFVLGVLASRCLVWGLYTPIDKEVIVQCTQVMFPDSLAESNK